MKIKILLFLLSLFSFILSIWYIRDMNSFWYFQKFYDTAMYQDAQNILFSKGTLGEVELHNLGNTFYMSSLGSQESQQLLEKSLESYSGALKKSEHPDTRYNYELVKKLIEAEKINQQKEQDKNQDQKSQQEDTSSQPSNGSGSQAGSGNTQELSGDESTSEDTASVIKNQRSEEYKMQESEKIEQLSPQEQKILDDTIQALLEEQQLNQQFFGKQDPVKSEFEKRFESLFGGSEEKDW